MVVRDYWTAEVGAIPPIGFHTKVPFWSRDVVGILYFIRYHSGNLTDSCLTLRWRVQGACSASDFFFFFF